MAGSDNQSFSPGTSVETLIDTAVGCPYGSAAEITIVAGQDFIDMHDTQRLADIGVSAYFADNDTAVEIETRINDMTRGILACETCAGDPHSVDLAGKVCSFALNACTGVLFTPPDIEEYQNRQLGN